MTENKLEVDGFSFRSRKDYERAKKEYETIQNLYDRIDMNNEDELISLYNKLVSKRYFQTQVGLTFMYDIRRTLKANNPNVSVPYIPVAPSGRTQPLAKTDEQYDKLKADYDRQHTIKTRLIIAVVAMAIAIIGMIVIVATNDNVGYFRTEEKLLNKYSAWEEQLEDWERQLIEREEALDNK